MPCSQVSISSDNYYYGLPPGVDAGSFNWDHPSAGARAALQSLLCEPPLRISLARCVLAPPPRASSARPTHQTHPPATRSPPRPRPPVDLSLLAEHLAALHRGEDVRVPHYDFARHARLPVGDAGASTFISARHTDAVICEGLFILADERVRAACDVTLGCVEDLDVCLARRLRRDIAERGRTVDSVLAQYVRFVKPGYHAFIAPSLNAADVLVPRAKENVVAIDMISKELARRITESAELAALLAGD